ncbi:MAG: tetratricopeptide repeat protein [Leptonema sp. (in: Bacteria)]|nr:tetratricopeptide repeat protein [Leptonema sp. (in: bacteria)]
MIILSCPVALLSRSNSEVIYAYRNYQGISPIKMILVGEIKSKIKSAEIFDKDSPFQDYDTRLDQVMVRVVNREGLKPGQKLYVIDKNAHHEKFRNGLIVGEIIVDSILTNPFYGLALTGKGILLRVREGQFVARTLETENLEKALQIKRRGDALKSRGQNAEAISEYLKAISADVDLADAHAALAELYAKEAAETGEYPIRAISHYRKAFKHRQNFDTNLDRYRFFVNYLAALRQARKIVENRYRNNENPLTEITDAVTVAEECMKISKHPDCKVEAALAYFDLMQFHSGRQSANHRTSYDNYRNKTGLLLKE